ncbi:hypothetical protein [Microbacterium sp. NPDC091662]|uniref:hypothetical protein n=1 Tax=Microbacterium sp. NPDC091662 TaxID=3364211 RepID=UPI00380D388A
MTLALLLILGFTVVAHGLTDGNGAAPSLAATAVDAFDHAAAADQEHVPAAAADIGASTLAGAALCALGVLSALAVLLLRTRATQRRTPITRLRVGSGARCRSSASHLRPRVTAIPLLQLGLSRT